MSRLPDGIEKNSTISSQPPSRSRKRGSPREMRRFQGASAHGIASINGNHALAITPAKYQGGLMCVQDSA